MSRNISLYIKDILENMERAEAFVAGMAFEEFVRDTKTSYALVRCLEVIGEAAKNVPQEVRSRYAEVPWKDMAGMRDVISHLYFGIDMNKVWRAVKEDIPRVKPLVAKVFKDMGG